MKRYTAILLPTFLVIATIGASACLRPESAGVVSVLASWVGAEETAFKEVLRRFTDRHGIRVDYQGTRAASQVLRAAVQNGTPPDVAVLPSPGELASYVAGGAVHDLDRIPGLSEEGSYTRQWQRLQKMGEENLYSITIKVELKSLIWYNPKHFNYKPPETWDQLIQLSKKMIDEGSSPWCLGLGDGPGSGWSGTDWIEDILLHQSGADTYERWSAGELPWTSERVRQAWSTWGEIVLGPNMVYGDAKGATLTDFGDAARPMFDDPPRCFLHRQASFMMGFFRGYSPQLMPGEHFDFFPFPRFGSEGSAPGVSVQEVSADLAAMFNNTPQARRLMEYLATQEAQSILPSETKGSVFSANVKVAKSEQRPVSEKIASTLTAEDPVLCFDASDLMPRAMTTAFYQAVLEYLHNQTKLDELLKQLDAVRVELLGSSDWFKLPCGR